MADVKFSINMYDNDGDSFDDGIFIHFNNLITYKVGESSNDLLKFITQLQQIYKEIQENYNI